jgi:predicted outer membrane repeat protein
MEKIKSIFILTCLLFCCAPAFGGTIYVDATKNGDGSSWATAYKYLQDGLVDANVSGYDIWVAAGTYKPDQGGGQEPNDREAAFGLINGVAIYGAFPSGGGDWNSRDPNTYETILSGDIGTPEDNSDNSYHVVTGSGTDATAMLDGFTITVGNADGSYPDYCSGGGMYLYNSSPTVKNCVFSGNSSYVVGGGVYCDQSSPTVKNCVFSGNMTTLLDGGGMANFFAASPNVSNCTFINNSAARDGGGMCNRKSSTDPNITNCNFINNSAGHWGGGMYNSEWAKTNVTNCTFVSNSAIVGGGMYNYVNSSPMVANCTFSRNWASFGGGMYNYFAGPTIATIVNCIFWENISGEIAGEPATVTYCDVKGGYGGPGNISEPPLFVDPNAGDYHLEPNSPCINAGDPCGVYAGQTDIDGEPRVFGSCVDMGSDEAWPDVEVAPSELEYDFGDVNIGTSDMTFVTIYNSGSANLTVSAISFTPDSNSDFSITSGPSLPAAIEPDGFVYVGITYSPSVEGYVTAILEIISDDPDEDLVQINLGGFGVQTELPPEGQIAEILAFFDASVADGGLLGSGPGKSAQGRLGALRNMIEASGDLIEDGLLEEACEQLLDAYNRIDGQPRPPEFAQGTAAPTLAGMIEGLRMSLECQ